MKIAWVCDQCAWMTISNSLERHKMDSCLCGACSCDLEEHYCRWSYGNIAKPRIIAKQKEGSKWKQVRKRKK